MFFFLKNKFTDKLISAVPNEFAAELESFGLSSFEKHRQFSHMGPWSVTYMTLENLHFANQIKKTLDKRKRPLFWLNIFKIFFIHVCERG